MNIESVKIRGLTRGEVRALRADGVKLDSLLTKEDEERDQALDRVFGFICPDMAANDLTPGEALELFQRIVAATYLSGPERKNSDSPQPSA